MTSVFSGLSNAFSFSAPAPQSIVAPQPSGPVYGGNAGGGFDLGGIGQIFASIGSALDAKRQMDAQAQLLQYQAAIANQRADEMDVLATANKAKADRRRRLSIAQQRQMLGEHGVVGGTSVDALAQNEEQLGLDDLTTLYNEQRRAQATRDQAAVHSFEAGQVKRAGRTALFSALPSAFSAAVKLTGGSSSGGSFNPFAPTGYS